MRAMLLKRVESLEHNRHPLELSDLPDPVPVSNQILIRVGACGVCHTELDEIEGRTAPPLLPVIPGHQVVGHVVACGPEARRFSVGERVGVAWIYSACGACRQCREGNENLCPEFVATGRDVNGGYAEYMAVSEDFAARVPELYSDLEAAPLLCAGAIGYRSLRLTGIRNGSTLGLTGFGASAHLILKMVKHSLPEVRICVFARNENERDFARELGAIWAGDTADEPPEELDCIIDTTPAWKPVIDSLKNLRPGGRLVINAIRKEEADKEALFLLSYADHLWMEKEIKSVANVTRKDVREFLQLAAEIPIRPEIQEYSLDDANHALLELKERKIRGAKVLRVG